MGQIDPVAVQAIWPWMQQPFGDWLFSGFSQKPDGGYSLAPLPSYPGALTGDPNAGKLKDVQDSWQPYDAGVSYLLDYFANNRGGIGSQDPRSTQMMKWGGTGGVGNQFMSNMAQFGAPSEAGTGVANMSQFGFSDPRAGGPMAALAGGQLNGPASFLAPFLTRGTSAATPYAPPNITTRSVQRRA